jgi:DNA-damage-inducible protein D
MKSETIIRLTETFEGHAQQTDTGVDYWLARDIQHLLGYAKWRNFQNVLTKSKSSCEVAGHAVTDQFVDVNKMVGLGSGGWREIDDVRDHFADVGKMVDLGLGSRREIDDVMLTP